MAKLKKHKKAQAPVLKGVDLVPGVVWKCLLVLLVLAVFGRCLGFHFLLWDDYLHFVSNPCVYSLSFNNLADLFQQMVNNTYIPLTVLSFNLEYHLFGASPFISHLINILLHAAVVWVVFDMAILLKLTRWESFVAAAIFALHPLHVESVAWVTERKDVLGILFYLLCLKQYWLYLKGNSSRGYALSLCFGFLSILTKATAVSIPWVLVLLDWYAQRRWNKTAIWDKLPFAALIFPVAALTFFKLSPHPAVNGDSALVFLWTMAWYLEKFFWPAGLLPLYSPPLPVSFSNPVYLHSLMVLMAFAAALIVLRKERFFIFACLFWLATIFIFWRLDFHDVNIVADRFMYLPSLGLCLIAGRYLSKFRLVSLLAIVILGYLTFYECSKWKDDLTLWSWTLAHDPKDRMAQHNQQVIIDRAGSRTRPFDYKALARKLDKDPFSSELYIQRGQAVLAEGNGFLAFYDFNKAIRLDPDNSTAYLMRGQLNASRGEPLKALADFNKAIALKPDNVLAYVQKANILGQLGEGAQAQLFFERALALDPRSAAGYYGRAVFYRRLGQYSLAIDDFSRLISLKEDLKDAYQIRGQCYEALRLYAQAEEDFKKALRQNPANIGALNELGLMYLKLGRDPEALGLFDRAISWDPYDANAYVYLGIIDLHQQRLDAALRDYSMAICLKLYPYHELITRGDIYRALGQGNKALQDYRLAVFFSQGDPMAQNKIFEIIDAR